MKALVRKGIVVNVIKGSVNIPGYECVEAGDMLALQKGDEYRDGRFYRGDVDLIDEALETAFYYTTMEGRLIEASETIVDLEIENAILSLMVEDN